MSMDSASLKAFDKMISQAIEDKKKERVLTPDELYHWAITEINSNVASGKKVVPFIGNKEEYIKMFKDHVEFIRDESKASPSFWPPDHPWLIQHVNTSAIKEVLERDLPVRKTLVEP